MKYIFIVLLFFGYAASAQTTSLSFDSIRYSANDFLAPGRGANTWYTFYQSVKIPDSTKTIWAIDNDTRFIWNDIEKAEGVYDFTAFDNELHQAIDSGQGFSFGIQPICSSCTLLELGGALPTASGSVLGYPPYLHTLMQAEATPDFNVTTFGSHSFWMPNWNSVSYINRLNALYAAVEDHIATGSYKGIAYSKVVYRIDIRGYGDFGEWHIDWTVPSGTVPTTTTMQNIIDAHINQFPDHPLTAIVNAFNTMGGTIPVSIAGYLLTTSNAWGRIGWRSDHQSSVETFYNNYTFANTNTYLGTPLSTYILNQYKYAPICGEPYGDYNAVSNNGAQCGFYNLVAETNMFHYASFSNEQLTGHTDACIASNYRAASKLSGYRIRFTSGSITSVITAGSTIALTLNWINTGIAPLYLTYKTQFILKKGSTTVGTYNSSFNPKLFLPSTSTTPITDNIVLTGITDGTYSLYVKIVDSSGYRIPLPLANTGRQADGSYLVDVISVGVGGGGGTGGGTGGGSNTNCTNCIKIRKYSKAIIKN